MTSSHVIRTAVRTAIVAALAAATLLGSPPAGATPTVTVLPERPLAAGQTAFVDDPAILDSRPQAVDSWSRVADPNAVAVTFTSGTPECHGVHAEVQQTPDIVAVKLRSGTVPAAVGRACIAIAMAATLTIPLDAPLGDRAVVAIT